MIILVKLIASHLIGDFMLQSGKMCRMKYSGNILLRLCALTVHSLIQSLLSYFCVGLWGCWMLPLLIFVFHFLIDFVKTQFGKDNLVSFVADQVTHYVVIVLIWWFLFVKSAIAGSAYASTCFLPISVWIVATSYVAVLAPTSILIKLFIKYNNWIPEQNESIGLPNAGKWIGYVERLLILTFIFTDNIEGVGFLLAAKSVFRFGELNNAKDLKFTEYVLIGTFTSFAVAVIIGFMARWLMSFTTEASELITLVV